MKPKARPTPTRKQPKVFLKKAPQKKKQKLQNNSLKEAVKTTVFTASQTVDKVTRTYMLIILN